MPEPSEAHAPLFYPTVAQHPRYGHYARIPRRVCRCLDHFGVEADRRAVEERLRAYYLFIGVADDAIDLGRLEAGREILRQFASSAPPDAEAWSSAQLLTEVLKTHVSPEIFPTALAKLEELYAAVVGERTARTVGDYIRRRKEVGRLTSELSYLLIRPLLRRERSDLLRFFQRVGEVGCLFDSLVDLKADERAGLLNFKPSLSDRLRLAAHTAREGLRLLRRHPRLFGLFCEALGDDLLDRLRSRAPGRAPDRAGRVEVGVLEAGALPGE
jgi:hypothetical protein